MGEIGLDYFIETFDRERQQALFEAQLQLAVDFNLPALIHVRRSHAAVIATPATLQVETRGHSRLRRQQGRGPRVHQARFQPSLGGAATWPQALRMHRVLAELPLESVVLETDSPDMAPAMFPGQRNSPAHLPAICEALAGIMAVSPQQLAAVSTANACELFNW